jgi:zinc-binding alcohol dehydrogenase family protein
MRAVGYTSTGGPEVLHDVVLDDPTPGPRDLLVEVRAISLNPVDTKIRVREDPPPGGVRVLGWDAVGVVREIGPEVTMFAPGDRVWYAGAVNRPGANSELHTVDERIVARAPDSLDDGEAAALPLTAITAWEMLFDRLGVPRGGGEGRTLLVVGAAGGVGSILVQLAAQLPRLTVIGTASRPETRAWVTAMGAQQVVDHRDLAAELRAAGVAGVDLIAALTSTDQHLPAYADIVAPQGRIAVIDDPAVLDVNPFKRKSVSVHWEFMFTRPVFGTADVIAQHELLTEVAALVDSGVLRTTVQRSVGPITSAAVRAAHELQESGAAIGKTVLVGWPAVS